MPALPVDLTIGELARRSAVATSALRFYESRGLIASERTAGGQRRYMAVVEDREVPEVPPRRVQQRHAEVALDPPRDHRLVLRERLALLCADEHGGRDLPQARGSL